MRFADKGIVGPGLWGVMLCLLMVFVIAKKAEGVNHGRDAYPGEFPYIVRIFISEHATGMEETFMNEVTSKTYREADPSQIGFVATGVLITKTRVLTTCDSVGFFTYGRTVKYYNTSLVNITGGTVKSADGGVTATPNNSTVHPYCYFLMSGYVLHNYGFYEVLKFETLTVPPEKGFPMQPIGSSFKSSRLMETALRSLYSGDSEEQCYTAGWGFPQTYNVKIMQVNFETNAEILQATKMTVVDFDYCYEQTCQFFNDCLVMIWEYGYVCAEAAKGGPCFNDKGAPLICGGQLFAIHNNPLSCTDEGHPRHFVRIDLAFKYIFNIKGSSTIARVTISIFVFAVILLIELLES